jgi:hypothetical protein
MSTSDRAVKVTVEVVDLAAQETEATFRAEVIHRPEADPATTARLSLMLLASEAFPNTPPSPEMQAYLDGFQANMEKARTDLIREARS